MIDWGLKIIELKAMADELEMWSGKTESHLHAMLGRNADELRAFIRQVEAELVPSERAMLGTPPGWVTDGELPPAAQDYDPYDDAAMGGAV